MRNPNEYNGWTNYATWRVMLEIFDGYNVREHFDTLPTAYDLSLLLIVHVDDLLGYDTNSLAVDYAKAFLAEVNWYEIAEHLLDNAKTDAEAA